MKKDVKQFLLKTWASLNAIFLIFQPLFALPLLFASAAPQAIASFNIEPESVQLEFDQDTYDFHISVESDQNLSYTLRYDDVSYEEPVSQAVTGVLTSEGTEGVVEAFVFAGTCSGTECVPVEFENGVLQIGGGYEVKFEQSDEYGLVQKNGDQIIYSNLKTDVQYGIEGHDDFSVTFSELPDNKSASLALRTVELKSDVQEKIGAASNIAYEVISNLDDGEYVYDLELPAPEEKQVEIVVKYAQSLEELAAQASVTAADMTSNEVRVSDLDHMTVFVVGTPVKTGNACVNQGATSGTDCYATISEALVVATDVGDVITVKQGTYNETTLNFTNPGVTLQGDGKVEIITTGIYGVDVGADVDNITIKDVTIIDNQANSGIGSSDGFLLKISHNDGFTLENVVLNENSNARVTAVDLNSVQNVSIKNVEINDFIRNGVAVTARYSPEDSSAENISFENISMNNVAQTVGWAGFAFYTLGGNDGHDSIKGITFSDITIDTAVNGIYIFGNEAGPTDVVTGPTNARLDLTNMVLKNIGWKGVFNYQVADVDARGALVNNLSGVNASATDADSLETLLVHDCVASAYDHGTCNGIDGLTVAGNDLPETLGSIEYISESETMTYAECMQLGEKIDICHASSSETHPFETLNITCQAAFGRNENSGHFNENGTPTSGHEDDYFGACKGDEEIDLQTISGHKYNSDTKEPIPGWGVTICKLPDDFDSENDNLETAECEEAGETTTDDNGYYEFTELVPGFYKVTEESKEGFVFMNPASGYHVVEAGASVAFSDNNKVLNASFEFPEVTSDKKWNIFESGSTGLNWLVEWTSLEPNTFGGLTRPTNGWLELHRGVNNWSAADGNQYAELDTDWAGPTSNVANEPANVTISQEISTCEVGSATFDVSFKYSPRPGQANNGLKVMWDDEELFNTTESGVGNSNTVWTSVSKSVTAGPGTSVLSFTETGTSDSLGMFVDDVSVVQKSACEGEDPSYDFYNAPVKPDPKPAKLVASKVICEDEKDLPNLDLDKPIDATTAQDWVNSHEGCYLAEGWNFQWGDQNAERPNDQDGVVAGLNKFGPTDENGVVSTQIDVSDISLLKVREVWNSDFIPFAGKESESNVSAELVCHTDINGYDNQEWIRNPEAGATYYCVAFNSPKEQPVDVTMCKEDETGAPLAGWTLGLSKDIGINQLVSVDGSGNEIPVTPADYVVYASGTYRYGNSVMIADAGNSYRPVGIPLGNNNWVSGDVLGTPGALELMIEGNNINWGLYNPAHTYSAFFPGFTDANISLSIYDDQYADNLNNGLLSARVEEVVAYGETEENGCVTIEGVKQGDYSVFEVPQTDWAYTQTKFGSDIQTQYPASVTIEEKNEEIVLTNEYRGSGSIEGVKFEDVNANGKNDEEPLLGDWKITLFDDKWNELKNTTTTENGYSFDDIPSGETYYVCEENQEGWTQTAAIGTVVENPNTKQDCVEVEVEPREAATASFGNFKQGFVQGRKYPDSNRNGVPDDAASEPWINGWTIRLYEVDDGWTSLGETVTGDTGETGQYKFDNLNPGEYAVCEVAKDGWEQTGPVLGAHTVDRDGNLVSDEVTAIENESNAADEAETCWTFSITSSNQSYGWVQFGNFEFGVIQGRKYLDRNTNGIPNSENEPFLDGWTINLYGMEKGEGEQDTIWTKMASAVTGDTTPEDSSGYVGVPPNVDGQFRFENLPAGEYALCEELPKDWYQSGPVLGSNPVKIDGASTGLDSLAIANESPDAETEGPNCWKVSVDKSGESYGYTMFGNYEPASIDGFKYFDEDKDTEFEENETGLAGWTITLRNKDTEETQTTETSEGGEGSKLGLFSFTGLRAGNYELCEEDRTADGWEQTEPAAPNYSETQERIQIQDEEVSEEETDQETSLRCYDIVVNQSGDEISRNFGNWIESSLLITKTNDAWPNDKQLGDTVKFTLTLQAVGGPVMGVSLTDVPAEHFDYNEGSYEAESSLGPKTVPEPTYASPGTWTVGDMAKDEVVTLSYTTKIKDSADPGIYPDMAWATGTSAQEEARGGENADLMALSLENKPGHYGEETFVGTQVAVVKEEQDFEDYAVKRIEEKQGSVLGVSTELPATGANIWTLILAALSVLVGAALIIFGRKKSMIAALVLCSAALLSSATSAQAATSIRLEEPYNTSAEFNSAAQTKQSDFKVDFVVLNQENLPVTAQCQISKDSGAWTDLSTIYTPKNGGNSGYCEAKSLSNQSSYKFRVVSIANAVTYYSNEVTVGIDKSGPSTPFSYSRYTSGSCTDVIKFKTANDNQTAWIEIYRSEQADSFVAKPDTRIASITIGPDTEGNFNADRPDCNKNYFYAIRAFDVNGNASGVIGDTQLQTIIVESADGTSESLANQLGALQVEDGRSFVNGADVSGEDGQEVKDGSTDQENSESASDEDEQNGSVLGVSDTAWFNALKDYALPIILGIIVLIGFYVLFFYKKK